MCMKQASSSKSNTSQMQGQRVKNPLLLIDLNKTRSEIIKEDVLDSIRKYSFQQKQVTMLPSFVEIMPSFMMLSRLKTQTFITNITFANARIFGCSIQNISSTYQERSLTKSRFAMPNTRQQANKNCDLRA